MINELTEEQVVLADSVANEWLSNFFENKLNSKTEAEIKSSCEEVYTLSGLSKPEVVVCNSPREVQTYLNQRFGTKDQKYEWSSFINASDFGWLSFYDFFERIGVVKNENLQTLITASKSSFMQVQLDGLCVVSRFPIYVNRNSLNQMHSVNGAAIEFMNGDKHYFINGVNVKEEMYSSLENDSFTLNEFAKLEDEELKAAIITFIRERFGSDKLADFFLEKLTVIDTYNHTENEPYILYKGNVNNVDIAFVQCTCPSSGRVFMLECEDTFTSAKDAIAGRLMLPKKLIPFLTEIRRQGEIINTSYTEEGMKMLESLTAEDFNNVEHVPGETYFKLISLQS